MTGTGNLKGTEGGEVDGKPGGSTAEQGGMRAQNATARGKGTAAHGMKGGTGPNSAQGVPSGWAIIPLINVPSSLRQLTHTLLIVSEANPGQMASNIMSRMTARTTVYRLRKNLKKRASKFAKNRLDSFSKKIDDELKHATQQQRTEMYKKWFWEIERQYFARVEQSAAAKLASNRLSRLEREQATKLLEAAKVKPLAGQLPRNHTYAGKAYPPELLPAAYRSKGLRFTEEGFPDFGPYAQILPNGQKSVKIKMTGKYRDDAKLANKAARLQETPEDMVWHHVEDGSTMILVPKDLHKEVKHSGGRATIGTALATQARIHELW